MLTPWELLLLVLRSASKLTIVKIVIIDPFLAVRWMLTFIIVRVVVTLPILALMELKVVPLVCGRGGIGLVAAWIVGSLSLGIASAFIAYGGEPMTPLPSNSGSTGGSASSQGGGGDVLANDDASPGADGGE